MFSSYCFVPLSGVHSLVDIFSDFAYLETLLMSIFSGLSASGYRFLWYFIFPIIDMSTLTYPGSTVLCIVEA